MPKKKQKNKLKTKKHKAQTISISLSLCPNSKSNVYIETNNKGNVFIKCKSKGIASKSSNNAEEILSYIYQNNKWDLISDIVSWCSSFNTNKLLDDNHWRQYIENVNTTKLTISKSTIKSITKSLQNVIDSTLNETYYSRKDWNEFGYPLSIKQLQLIFASYFKRYINDKYIIPKEIIKLCYSFYGSFCRFHIDLNNVLSFEFKKRAIGVDTLKNAEFIDLNGRYILFKQNFILNKFDSCEFNLVFKPIHLTHQIFNIGIAIYNERISNDIMNEELVFVEKKYRQRYRNPNFIWLTQKEWNKDEIYILRVTFDLDDENEDKMSWSLSVALYNGNGVLERTFYRIKELKSCDLNTKHGCHIIMDTLHSHRFKLKLLDYIDPFTLNSLEWRDNLNVGDTVYILHSLNLYRTMGQFKIIDIDDDDNLIYRKYEDGNVLKIHKNNHRLSRDQRTEYGGSLDLFSDRI